MYRFKTEIENIPVIVEGVFEAEEPRTQTDPGCSAAFIIENITIEAADLEDELLARIEAEAFDQAASDAADEY